MRRIRVFSSLALVACASGKGASSPAATTPSPQETVRLSGGGGVGQMLVDTHPTSETARITVDFPMDRVWNAMKAAYDSLGVPVTSMDQASHTIGNNSMRIRRRLGDVPMSKYVNCGNVQGVQSADAYEVVGSIVTRLDAPDGPSRTRMTTLVDFQGRPMTIAAEFTRCTTTGQLEKRLSELVAAQLKR